MRTVVYYNSLREKLNEIHQKLSNKPDEYKYGYYHSPGSILNAYREGDISFEDAEKILKGLIENAITASS